MSDYPVNDQLTAEAARLGHVELVRLFLQEPTGTWWDIRWDLDLGAWSGNSRPEQGMAQKPNGEIMGKWWEMTKRMGLELMISGLFHDIQPTNQLIAGIIIQFIAVQGP